VLSLGPQVPGYEILAELGRGGMGVVYQARQIALKRVVALKMILAGKHASPAELARFRAEAEAVAQFQHPHIVQIHEGGEHHGLPYFSLEFVDGGNLTQKLAGTPLPVRQAAELMEMLARAMHYAHQRGIVHRDLKPANVLLTADGTPKVTDFGLAKRLVGDAGQTTSGAILGTPSYMAPEQAAGKTKEVGPPADVYALGAILYEVLTGRPPFRAATPLDTLLQVVSDEPVPPSRLQSKVPRELETICLKCLQKEPRKRYASAEALAEDLRRFLNGEPIWSRPVGAWERGWRWCQREPVVAGLLGAVAAALVLGMGATSFFALRAQKRQTEAEEQRDRAELLLYGRQIADAKREWEAGNVEAARQLLDAGPGIRQ
jgi:serine/threonine protein kinase